MNIYLSLKLSSSNFIILEQIAVGFLPLIVGGYQMANEKSELLEFLTNTKKGITIFLIVWAIGMLFLSQLVGNPFGNISY